MVLDYSIENLIAMNYVGNMRRYQGFILSGTVQAWH